MVDWEMYEVGQEEIDWKMYEVGQEVLQISDYYMMREGSDKIRDVEEYS